MERILKLTVINYASWTILILGLKNSKIIVKCYCSISNQQTTFSYLSITVAKQVNDVCLVIG